MQSMHDNLPRLAIFDLGNVIFQFSWDHAFTHWGKVCECAAQEIQTRCTRLFFCSRECEAFERGELTPMQIYQHFCAYTELTLTFEQFVAGWDSIYDEVYDDSASIIRHVRSRIPVVAFTNTNALHNLV